MVVSVSRAVPSARLWPFLQAEACPDRLQMDRPCGHEHGGPGAIHGGRQLCGNYWGAMPIGESSGEMLDGVCFHIAMWAFVQLPTLCRMRAAVCVQDCEACAWAQRMRGR